MKTLCPRHRNCCAVTLRHCYGPCRSEEWVSELEDWFGTQLFTLVFPHFINACIFTSAFSSGNSFLFSASRVLYGLSLRGQAPKYLTYCTKKGLPLAAVLTAVSWFRLFKLVDLLIWLLRIDSLLLLSYRSCPSPTGRRLSSSKSSNSIFRISTRLVLRYIYLSSWLVSLTTVGGFLGWFAINLTYARFCAYPSTQPLFICFTTRLNRQMRDWMNRALIRTVMPITAVFSLIFLIGAYFGRYCSFWLTGLRCSLNGTLPNSLLPVSSCLIKCFCNFTYVVPLQDISIPIFVILFVIYKVSKRSKFWRASEMDFYTVRDLQLMFLPCLIFV